MRTLTVIRKRSIVACFCGVHIYIQCDRSKADLILDGIPCKDVGRLKNGKTLTAKAPNDEFKVFVVYSKTQPQNYHSACAVSAGGDITLYAKPRYDPAMGNPFSLSDKP